MSFQAAIITVSDRTSKGETVDKTGPALEEYVTSIGYKVSFKTIVPDELPSIQSAIVEAASHADLILTTGGTGFGVRDTTPEAVKQLIHKECSGLTIAMITESLKKTPLAALSRPICGIFNHSIIVTLPGSKKGALENLQAIDGVLAHALDLCRGEKQAGEAFHQKLHGGHQQATDSNSTHKMARNSCHHHHSEPTNSTGKLSNESTLVTRRARVSPYPMVSYDQALSEILEFSKSSKIILKKLEDLVGYVVAEDVISQEAVPAYRASIVDGYAVIRI